ncbi:MarR family winged helix-turn-helix transcriptional regulator [Paenibacillus sp. J31TS4]|uniref:MarR family winged helix-turn-helix transcriptional regulator n=1 Tax=Paenibacillus sp. J31TS4 TaxID=2807195 RepID=UPI0020C164C6|nr:MarR family transcriptional regulator [Paenibacillus sp. J31TS4]
MIGFEQSKKEQLSRLISGQITQFVIQFSKLLESDLTASQYAILHLLKMEGPQSSSRLAEALGVTLPAVTNLANKLVRKGYVERTVPETDRRTVLLSITEEGLGVVNRMDKHWMDFMEELLEDTSSEELDALIASYDRIGAKSRKVWERGSRA